MCRCLVIVETHGGRVAAVHLRRPMNHPRTAWIRAREGADRQVVRERSHGFVLGVAM